MLKCKTTNPRGLSLFAWRIFPKQKQSQTAIAVFKASPVFFKGRNA
jgi:hypothetical protein